MNALPEVTDKNAFEAASEEFKKTITFDEKGRLLFGRICPTEHTGEKAYVTLTTRWFSQRVDLLKAYELAKKLFSKTFRLSWKWYISHLENTDGYYRFFCPNPSISWRKKAFHHDSIEDFPESIGIILATIWQADTEEVVYLSKFKPKLLAEAKKFPKLFWSRIDVYEEVSRVVESCKSILYGTESLRSMLQIGMVWVMWRGIMWEHINKPFSLAQWTLLMPSGTNEEIFLMGDVFHGIVRSGDREDIVRELALIKNLFQTEDIDSLYAKLCERLDNLTSIEKLEELCNEGKNLDEIKKLMQSCRKALATTLVYLYIAREKLKDPRLYGALEYMIEWNKQKLETFDETIERREKEWAFTKTVTSPASSPSS